MSADAPFIVYGLIGWLVLNVLFVAFMAWAKPGAWRNVPRRDGSYPD